MTSTFIGRLSGELWNNRLISGSVRKCSELFEWKLVQKFFHFIAIVIMNSELFGQFFLSFLPSNPILSNCRTIFGSPLSIGSRVIRIGQRREQFSTFNWTNFKTAYRPLMSNKFYYFWFTDDEFVNLFCRMHVFTMIL